MLLGDTFGFPCSVIDANATSTSSLAGENRKSSSLLALHALLFLSCEVLSLVWGADVFTAQLTDFVVTTSQWWDSTLPIFVI